MPQAVQPKGTIDRSRLERYLKRHPGEGYLWLACQAAFFVALTPGLLYRLWVNFKYDEKGKVLDIPLDAVSALLNSPLCRELGQGVYEIHESLRAPLLSHLRGEERFGSPRLYRLARFLLAYLDYCGNELPSPAFAEAQRWTAEAYLKPELAAQRLLEAFNETVDGRAAASSVEVYLNWISSRGSEEERSGGVDPLAVAEQLVRGMRNYQKGAKQEAIEALRELAEHIKTGGSASPSAYRTKIPEEILELIKPGPGVEVELEPKGTVRALLVAVGKMASGQATELEGPGNDLRLIRKELTAALAGRDLEANVLEDSAATKEAVLRQWWQMVEQARPEDHLLFYFSGHAENKRDHYLILYDYQEQSVSKVESIKTVTGGVIYDGEFREASGSCRGFITLILDTHAGGEGWLDLSNDKNVILSATLPRQIAYEQRFGETTHGLFSKALLEVLKEPRYRSSKWVVRKAAEWMKESSNLQQDPIVLGNPAAQRRPILGQGVSDRPNIDYLLDLLKANGYLKREPGQVISEAIQACWDAFADEFSLPDSLELTEPGDMETATDYLEKALLFKEKDGLSMVVPAMPDTERELFQLELSMEELLNVSVHINRKKENDGDLRNRIHEPFNYLDHFGGSQVILVPIHENRMGEEGYEQMLREARYIADTYDKLLVGVLEAYCTYESHPILGNIPVVPRGQAGSGTVARPLTVYESREEAWRAVAQGVADLLEPYRPFFQPGIQGSVIFDTENEAWCFDKGRKDGVSIWHREVQVQAPSGSFGLPIKKVAATKTYFGQLAGFDPEPSEVFHASIRNRAERNINILAEDHADNAALIRELTEGGSLPVNWTKDIPGLDYVLHFTQTHCYLSRAFEDTNDNTFDIYLNPYRPLTKLIELSSGIELIREFLRQVAEWEFLRRLEAPYNEQVSEEALEIKVYHSQGNDWEELAPQDEWMRVPLWAKQQKEGVSYENTIRIQLANRSGYPLYVSVFLLSEQFGAGNEATEDIQFKLEPGEEKLLYQYTGGSIPVELSSRALAYNLPYEALEAKFLAGLEPFSTDGFRMGYLPGAPGSLMGEEEGYFTEKGRLEIRIRPLNGEWIAPLLKIRFDNPAYNRPQLDLLANLLRRPDVEPFLRALYFESFQLAPRYQLKQRMELQEEGSSLSETVQAAPQPYAYTPDGQATLEYQLQQLRPQLQGKAEKPILIALGDSWFNQAQPMDISHFLMEDFIVVHTPLQDWGQLEEAVRRLEKMVEGILSITLLLSPMGERLLDKLEEFIKEGAPDNTDDIREILNNSFYSLLDELGRDWEKGFGFLSRFGSRLQVVAHGYDYFAFEQFGGLAFYQRPGEWRRDLSAFIIDLLNARIRTTVNESDATNIHYLDLRKTLEPGDWTATLIPTAMGFRKLTGAVSLFIEQQYRWEEEPYPGTEYFLWQVAQIANSLEAYQQLIGSYPDGEHRERAEKRLKELQPESPIQFQSQSFELEEAVQEQEPDALASLRRRTNELISTNRLGELFELLDKELKPEAEPRESLSVFQKQFERLENQRLRYNRPDRKLDQDIASLADAVEELVEGLAADDLREVGSLPGRATAKTGRKSEVGNRGPEPESTNQPINQSPKLGSFTDPRDGHTYRTVELNGLVWIAENLSYDVGEGCWFYDDDPKNGEKYGRLYTWEAAYWACPSGWRLPTDEEWRALMDSFGDGEKAYEALIEGGTSGFDAVLGGRRTIRGSFYDMESLGGYWSATEKGTQEVWCYYFQSDARVMNREDFEQARGFSCRCVQEIGAVSGAFPEEEVMEEQPMEQAEAPKELNFYPQKDAFHKIRQSQSDSAARFFVLHGQEGSRLQECEEALREEFFKEAVVFRHSLEDVNPETDAEGYWKKLITRFAEEKGLQIAGRNLGLGSLINQLVDLIQGQPVNHFVLELSVHHRFWNAGIPALVRQQLDNQEKAAKGILGRLTRMSAEMDFIFVLTHDEKTKGAMLEAFEGLLPGCVLPEL